MTCKNILGLDAAQGSLTACLLTSSGTFLRQTESTLPLSQDILPCIEGLMQQAKLDWHDLDAFAFGSGPGSFTGLRVVAATLAGLNSRLQLPMVKLCSLYMTYLQADTKDMAWVIEDARTQSVYSACFHKKKTIHSSTCMLLTQMEQVEPSDYVAQQAPQDGLDAWQALSLRLDRAQALEKAIKYINWNDASQRLNYPELNYLQVSQAERMMQ